ncbi:MAG: hypothetical protein OWV35_09485 [Firmicutes bacterium]|nr:hypothetical protein [Bacillota bacterium]
MMDMILNHMLLASGVNIANTKAASTISSLITSAGTWIAGLGVSAGGLMVAYHALMRNLSGGDGATDAHHLQAMKKVIVGTAIVAGAGGLAHFAGGLF